MGVGVRRGEWRGENEEGEVGVLSGAGAFAVYLGWRQVPSRRRAARATSIITILGGVK